MVKYITDVVGHCRQSAQRLNADEREVFSLAFKKAVQMRRLALRDLNTILGNAQGKHQLALLEYKQIITDEFHERCSLAIALIDSDLIPMADGDSEGKVFYTKMKADYYRYM